MKKEVGATGIRQTPVSFLSEERGFWVVHLVELFKLFDESVWVRYRAPTLLY